MNILYNGNLLHEEQLRLPLHNRAFQYNDGFFETVMVVNGKLRFWQDHLERMQAAAQVLKIGLPAIFTSSSFETELLNLSESNGALAYGRLKLKVWRGGAGIYTPETNTAEWLATVKPAEEQGTSLSKVGISTSVRTDFSPRSFFKGPNSLLYVMAGIEKKERQFDDLILLNKQDLISEMTSSNIFWYQQNTLYTPALETGCINGIMRRNILKWCGELGIKAREAYFDVEGMLQADTVFAANVTGIREIKNLMGFELSTHDEVTSMLRDRIKTS